VKKQFALLLLFSVCFLFISQSALAARSIVIISDKSLLSGDEEMTVNASTSGFTNGETIYIKGAFFKDGSSNYFGLTKLGDSWVKNSTTALSQRGVIIGNWDNNIEVKPDYLDSGFTGIGDYKFKLGFYYLTSGGNVSSVNWSNDIGVSLNAPPSPTPLPTLVKSSSTTASSIYKSPTPTKIPSPTKQSSSAPSSKIVSALSTSNTSTKFAKISNEVRPASEFAKIKPITQVSGTKKKVAVLGANETNPNPILLLSGGMFLILAGGWLGMRELKRRKIL
jgi:hypothetical protein